MKRLALLTLAALACAVLAGCLEVEQHPVWKDGQYDGKPDNLPQQVFYHGDRMDWMATIMNRNWHQDEYPRSGDKGANYD